MKNSVLSIGIIATAVSARDVTDNVWSFYNRVKDRQCTGDSLLEDGFRSKDDGSSSFAYCKYQQTGVLYLHGEGSYLADMDVDCDGVETSCRSGDTQYHTAFPDLVKEYSRIAGSYVEDLDAAKIPYVVFGNEGDDGGYIPFDPKEHGIKALSAMAVICNGQLFYGVWGDTNGDDGPPLIGEASLSLAKACFPSEGMSGKNGHGQDDVLYIAFPGDESDTVHKHAKWNAGNFEEFEESISEVGDLLVKRLY